MNLFDIHIQYFLHTFKMFHFFVLMSSFYSNETTFVGCGPTLTLVPPSNDYLYSRNFQVSRGNLAIFYYAINIYKKI